MRVLQNRIARNRIDLRVWNDLTRVVGEGLVGGETKAVSEVEMEMVNEVGGVSDAENCVRHVLIMYVNRKNI